MKRLLALIALLGLLAAPALAQDAKSPAPAAPLDLDATPIPLGGKLANPTLWATWKSRFVTEQGRVIDTANGAISHSEGQGYGMLLAVAANDRPVFDAIWGWTRANLMVRDDELMAWRFDPDKRPGVADMNNATDGDILAAWALTEAAEFWADDAYRAAARRVAVELARKTVIYKTAHGSLILPGVAGYSARERQGAPVVNLSYYVFPAFPRLKLVAPEIDWAGMTDSGLDLMMSGKSGPLGLPAEWLEARGATIAPAPGFSATFGYNAIRIPLYMAWAGVGEREHYAPFVKLWGEKNRGRVGVMDVATGATLEAMPEPGYRAIPALLACVTSGEHFPLEAQNVVSSQNYYPATLQAMAVLAAQMRFPSCLKN